MERVKKIINSPKFLFVLLVIKLVTYYLLLQVNLLKSLALLESFLVLTVMYYSFARGKGKHNYRTFLILYLLFSIVMFADTMYYNYYNQTCSVKQIWQLGNVAKVPKSFVATLIPASFLVILDIPFVARLFKREMIATSEKPEEPKIRTKRKYLAWFLAIYIFFASINPMNLAVIDLVTGDGFFVNHMGDIYDTVHDVFIKEKIPKDDLLTTIKKEVLRPVDENLHGIAEGRNVILIQVEALQNFVIGREYNGQVLTPNLNALLHDNTLYFDNYYSTIGKGNTVDAEFTTLNSLYPVIEREAYTLYEKNTFNGLPWLLKDLGYQTFAVHGYEGEFWNRRAAYPYQGIDNFYSLEDLDSNERIGLGISDRSMLHQAVQKIKEQKGSYFAFLNTLTNHHPYEMDESLWQISLKEEHKDTKFGSYLQTVHYTDQAIGQFIQELKQEGVYDNTIICIYGDHHGLNYEMDNNEEIMTEYLGKPYDYNEMLRIPLLIHIPGVGISDTISTLGGQIDFLPTLANLMNIDIPQPYVLGQDLVNAKSGFVAFTAYLLEGSFAEDDVMFEVSRQGTFEGGRAWKRSTNETIEDISLYREYYEKALALKKVSKQVLEQDLMKEQYSHEVVEATPKPEPAKSK